ncbi:uncharacterized protein KNN_04051 [Bacillus thuringiensis serovar tolworthi]|uniref:Uncharacterized protein n=1 Tax=Bacillus thuringiensis subsp. tolworthi TaxID=1442 RepID=A0A9W4EV44_BACTO|nr:MULTISPECIES: hypothetical protein [Bacillus cereus group]MEB8715169.1 hypothetical protein [Bacillus cereus]MDR5047614.1 hypothetical protein [Bacillus thuringiensis]MEB8855699.1 hypothetical protein [Bacillus cereus]MEB9419590.1 hypothetical protein [Bacillus cereus]MEB9433000.1 hypothetical protein [Bacillus cereus]
MKKSLKEQLIDGLSGLNLLRENTVYRIEIKKLGGSVELKLESLEEELKIWDRQIKEREDMLFEIMKEERAI